MTLDNSHLPVHAIRVTSHLKEFPIINYYNSLFIPGEHNGVQQDACIIKEAAKMS